MLCLFCAYIISMSPHSVDRWSLIVVGVHFLIAYILIVYTLVVRAGRLALLESVDWLSCSLSLHAIY